MDQAIASFLKAAIEMELNVGEVYQLFSVKFPVDHDFWWKISIEEMNHAALIESINDIYFSDEVLTPDSIARQTNELVQMNMSVKQMIERFRQTAPTRQEAFQCGYELENSVGEFHFELFMTGLPDSPVKKIFQRLNGDDINHAARIEAYRKENAIF